MWTTKRELWPVVVAAVLLLLIVEVQTQGNMIVNTNL